MVYAFSSAVIYYMNDFCLIFGRISCILLINLQHVWTAVLLELHSWFIHF